MHLLRGHQGRIAKPPAEPPPIMDSTTYMFRCPALRFSPVTAKP